MDCKDNKNGISGFLVDKMLTRLIQPYDQSRLERLKTDLINTSRTRVIHVWEGYHIEDLEVYEICRKNGLEYVVWEMDFADVNEAAIHICKSQLKRPDLTPEYKKYLIGQRYECEKALKSDMKSWDPKYKIAAVMAKELMISVGTVLKYGTYALAVNDIFDQDITFAKNILSGKVRISHENIIELARLRPEEIRAVARSSAEEKVDHITLPYIRNEVKWAHVQVKNKVSRREKSEEKVRNGASIRQMPEYDPDSEVNSLCMTIDSWISSIQRVSRSDNFPKITKGARLKLLKKMTVLEHTINTIQESIVERTGE